MNVEKDGVEVEWLTPSVSPIKCGEEIWMGMGWDGKNTS